MKQFKTILLLVTVVLLESVKSEEVKQQKVRQPIYKYRYQTEDLMKTAESNIPVHGYHFMEGGYYPQGQFQNFQGGFPMFQHHQPYFPQAFGGEYVDKNAYQNGHQQQQDAVFKKAQGVQGESLNQGQEGFTKGSAAIIDNKGDTGYYSDQKGGKQAFEDGKEYTGSQHQDHQGKTAQEESAKQGHRKGHVIKGFKTSHHKDESGKTEEYYDEANDEADHLNAKGQKGTFGQQNKSSFKGGQENGSFNADQSKKEGHYQQQHAKDNANADKGQYGNNKFYTSGQAFGLNNGMDQQSLMGHQEGNRFFKQHPYYSMPFFNGHY